MNVGAERAKDRISALAHADRLVPSPASSGTGSAMGGGVMGDVESRWSVVAGVRWHARASRVDGTGRPVILVHGLGVSGRYMVPLLRRLAVQFQVVAPDLPGSGRSADPVEPQGPAEMADALAGWMSAAGVRRAALVGHSLGCQVTAHFAQRHPERLMRAVLVSPTMDPSAPKPRQQVARLLWDVPRERWPLPLIASRDYIEAGMRRGLRTLHAGLRDAAAEHYREIHVPTLVVRGGRDPIVSAAWAEEVSRLAPQARLVTVPGAPHAVNFSAPDALTEVIGPFLLAPAETSP